MDVKRVRAAATVVIGFFGFLLAFLYVVSELGKYRKSKSQSKASRGGPYCSETVYLWSSGLENILSAGGLPLALTRV
jgi:hypothetical protein